MDCQKVDHLIEYALAAAGEEDYGRRELGPIHVLEYVYLADLAYARRHEGKTYTDATWRFHHFGPWSPGVHARIEPTARRIRAEERRVESKFGREDFVRWTLRDETLLRRLESVLPWEASGAIKRAVHQFSADTADLLHYVYKTKPMLQAAPGEILVFDVDEKIQPSKEEKSSQLTVKQQKRQQEKHAALRNRVQELLQKKIAAHGVPPRPEPRYDEVFFEGQQWLEQAAGEPIEPEQGELEFSDEIWKSASRNDPDIP